MSFSIELDTVVERILASMPVQGGSFNSFLRQEVRKTLRAELEAVATSAPTRPYKEWKPEFECQGVAQETLVIKFCAEMQTKIETDGRAIPPLRLLEMAEELYQAERKDLGPLMSNTSDEVPKWSVIRLTGDPGRGDHVLCGTIDVASFGTKHGRDLKTLVDMFNTQLVQALASNNTDEGGQICTCS